jgi:hypothetical protein
MAPNHPPGSNRGEELQAQWEQGDCEIQGTITSRLIQGSSPLAARAQPRGDQCASLSSSLAASASQPEIKCLLYTFNP